MTAVFRGLDRDALDALLDVRRRVPTWQTWTDRFEERSAAVRASARARLDVPYGPHPRERLDVFLPPDAVGPVPVHVFFHGGYWRSSDKERYSFIAEPFLPRGVAYVAVEYALVPTVDLDELVRQCRAALAYVHANAAALGLDAGRIGISGHSAGGHIVGMLAARGWHAAHGVPEDVAKGVCGVSGLYDLEAIRCSYLNETLGLDAASVARNSPSLLRPVPGVPFLAAVGGDEGEEFMRQNALVRAAWGDETPVDELVLPGGNHYHAVEALADPASPLCRAALRHLGVPA